ncbi:MAG: PHP domain-containing protein [Firmicutes bacterium]|nr:PHP domain-containing protein [Bacillota bacterium]
MLENKDTTIKDAEKSDTYKSDSNVIFIDQNTRFYGDYHTHTTYSHGTGSILDNAKAARDMGIREIAITDHGFSHMIYNVTRRRVSKILTEIESAKAETGVSILFSTEANFTGSGGFLDLREPDLKQHDIIIAGYHHLTWPRRFLRDGFGFFLPNHLGLIFGASKRRKQKNTQIVLKALERYPIDILTHLNHSWKVNLVEIAKACAENGTLIEINGKRISFTYEQFLQMAEVGAKFIITSDAHSACRIGDFKLGLDFLKGKEIPAGSIVNINERPKFRSEK